MTDQSALLQQLKIDREPPRNSSGGQHSVWIWGGIAVLLVAGALAAWLAWLRPSALEVQAVVAHASVGANGGGGAASILDASGYVVARRQATVSAKITGKVTEVLIEEGQKVKAGEVVAKLDDANIHAQYDQAHAALDYARASVEQLTVQLANAERDFARKQALYKNHYVSQTEFDAAQTSRDSLQAQLKTAQSNVHVSEQSLEVAKRSLDDTIIHAPFAGVITVKAAQPGEIVSPISAGGGFTRTGIGTIVDMDSLEIEVDVNENFINRVSPGQPASAKLNAYPDWSIPARVIAVIPTADRSKATVKVRVGFQQKDERILPEMGVRVSFLSAEPAADATSTTARAIWVPSTAVQVQGNGLGAVYLIKSDNILERRAVRLGGTGPDGQAIMSGLSGGERLAVGPLEQFHDGLQVKVQAGS